MAHKKNNLEPSESPEEQALEAKVDAMMDIHQPDRAVTPSSERSADTKTPPMIDIFKDQPGAPPLDGHKITVRTNNSAKSITEPEKPSEPKPVGPLGPYKPKTAAVLSAETAQKTSQLAESEPEVPAETDVPVAATDEPEIIPAIALDDQADNDTLAPTAESTDRSIQLDEKSTDRAVDDIAAHDSDSLLAVEDKDRAAAVPAVTTDAGRWTTFKKLFKNKWFYAALALIIIAMFVVPVSRDEILGLFIKQSVTIQVIDNQTSAVVSDASVSYRQTSATTNADGKTTLRLPYGKRDLQVSKQYYQTDTAAVLVGFHATSVPVRISPAGRETTALVTDKVSGLPLAGATISLLNTTAKTSSSGRANIVLPTNAGNLTATIKLAGYNTAQLALASNSNGNFQLTPSGQIYFLANDSGSIDVVKTNLDGSGRKVVVAGTSTETAKTTSLLASRDWHYLVLKAQHDSSQASLYLINTSNDQITPFDNSNASITPIGWDGHDFIYDLQSNSLGQSQAGHEVIKSYDADHQQLNQLDQNQVSGSGSSYAYQQFGNFHIINNQLLYSDIWLSQGGYSLSSQNDVIRGIAGNGTNQKDYQKFTSTGSTTISSAVPNPGSVDFAVNNGSGPASYYQFTNGSLSQGGNLTASNITASYPNYLLSPTGSSVFWLQTATAAKATGITGSGLYVSNSSLQTVKQLTSSTTGAAYGWYSDNYLITAKAGQLYIMSARPTAPDQTPLKISNYLSTAQSYPQAVSSYGGR